MQKYKHKQLYKFQICITYNLYKVSLANPNGRRRMIFYAKKR